MSRSSSLAWWDKNGSVLFTMHSFLFKPLEIQSTPSPLYLPLPACLPLQKLIHLSTPQKVWEPLLRTQKLQFSFICLWCCFQYWWSNSWLCCGQISWNSCVQSSNKWCWWESCSCPSKSSLHRTAPARQTWRGAGEEQIPWLYWHIFWIRYVD